MSAAPGVGGSSSKKDYYKQGSNEVATETPVTLKKLEAVRSDTFRGRPAE